MGQIPASHVANAYLKRVEALIVGCGPTVFHRYLGNLFLIWPNTTVAERLVKIVATWRDNIMIDGQLNTGWETFFNDWVIKKNISMHHAIHVKKASSRHLFINVRLSGNNCSSQFTSGFLRYLRLSSEESEASREAEILIDTHTNRGCERKFLEGLWQDALHTFPVKTLIESHAKSTPSFPA